MPYKVLIAEDSNFFQMRLKDIINECPELEVIGIATNGQEAIDMAAKLKPDIISMDYEMPFLDGLSAVKVIMSETPTPIVMFSSMTYEGAKITLDALDAGALDFMNKNFAEVSADSKDFKKKFHNKLINFAKSAKSPASLESSNAAAQAAVDPVGDPVAQSSRPKAVVSRPAARAPAPRAPAADSSGMLKGKVKLVAIGASTGGPVALSEIISALPSSFTIPIIIVQHMPENFTRAFSERLDRSSALRVKEAEHGDRIERGQVLVAPGGKQMLIDRSGKTIKIIDGDDRVNYRPCVDISFASAASAYGDAVLAIVLTGMGTDGCDGAKLLREKGSTIWSQDEGTCVVYGMPAAVERENISTCVLPIKEFAQKMTGLI